LNFGPWSWGALHMGFVDQQPSRMFEQFSFSFSKLTRTGNNILLALKKSIYFVRNCMRGCRSNEPLAPFPGEIPPLTLCRGWFNVRQGRSELVKKMYKFKTHPPWVRQTRCWFAHPPSLLTRLNEIGHNGWHSTYLSSWCNTDKAWENLVF